MADKHKTTFPSILTNRSAAKLKKLAPNADDPLILVNVSGVEYKVKSSYLSRFPDSLLYKMVFDRQDDDSADDVAQTTLTSLPPSYECSLPSYEKDGARRREPQNVSATIPTSPPPSPRQKTLFFQRSPLIFDLVILQSYVTGKLHVPRWMCAESILEELKFWQLDISYACSCCAEERQEVESRDSDNEEDVSTPALPDESEVSALLLAKKDGGRPSRIAKRFSIPYAKRQSIIMLSRWQRKKRRMWTFVQDPSSSFEALLFAIVSLLFVFLSIAHLTVESFRSFSFCPLDSCDSNSTGRFPSSYAGSDFNDRRFSISVHPNVSSSDYDSTVAPRHSTVTTGQYQQTTMNWTTYFGNTTTNGGAADSNSSTTEMGDDPLQISLGEAPCQYLSACPKRRVLQYFEFLTMAWFTLELLLRIVCCPGWVKFLRSPLNLIDVVSTIPFYVELTVILIRQAERSHPAHKAILVLQLLRCLRVFRILKLARYFEELRILGNTLKAAKKELYMLFLFVSIAIFVFSSIIYQFEKDQPNTLYTNIPASAWFGIATVTTVGYGDMTPSTIAGKIIASIACITGVMITAFPVSILVEHFTSTYKNKGKRMFVVPRFKYRMPFHKARKNKDSSPKDIVMVRSQPAGR